jgi:hypothetical protein
MSFISRALVVAAITWGIAAVVWSSLRSGYALAA